MKKTASALSIFFITLFSSIPGSAADLDTALNNAKQQGKVVMLELGSVGCIPCEQMKPVMQKLSTTYKGKIEVIFIDVKKDRGAAMRYGVYMIPVQVFLDKNGKEFYRHLGYFPYEEIKTVLKRAGL
jgi:thioredoxin 1